MIRILFLGDIVGKPGRKIVADNLSKLKREHAISVTIANGENSAGGLGIDPGCAAEIYSAGVDIITGGNHVWKKKEVRELLERERHRMLRPANYPIGAPGTGVLTWKSSEGWTLRVINLIGRVFIPDLLDCPFQAVNSLLQDDSTAADITLVDFHAEATSEKVAMGYHLDGRVEIVLGTHTHVQTADQRILPKGTAFITDVGMCGPSDGVIGVSAPVVVEKFISGLPNKFELASGPAMINAAIFDVDPCTFKAVSVTRLLVHG